MRAIFFVLLLLPFVIPVLVDDAFAADTWTAATTTNVGTTLMRGVSMSDASNGVAVGGSGQIVYTSDGGVDWTCLLYTSPSPRDKRQSRMPSSA